MAIIDALPHMSGDGSGSPASNGDADAIPTIQGFVLIEPLGRGGMGAVWKARQIATGRIVALKLLHAPAMNWIDPKARARFEMETKFAARVEHPNVARLYEAGVDRAQWYCVMEYVEGQPLTVYQKAERPDDRSMVRLMVQVIEAIQAIHSRGLIHRDIKPANILVRADGTPVIVDFGLAKDLESDIRMTAEGTVAGTLAYMSPEQARGEVSRIDTRSDIYAAGVVLYEMLTGSLPHDASGSDLDLRNRKATEDARPARRYRRDLAVDLQMILAKAVARDPAARYATAQAFADDLRRWLAGRPVDARRPTAAYVLKRWLARNRAGVALATGVLAVIVTMAVAAYLRVVDARDDAVVARQIAEAESVRAHRSERDAQARLAESLMARGDAEAARSRWYEAKDAYRQALATFRASGRSTEDAELALTEALGNSPPPVWQLPPQTESPISAIAVSADGSRGWSGHRDGTVVSWDLVYARVIHVKKLHRGYVSALAASHDGTRIFIASDDKTAGVWIATSLERLSTIESSDDTMLAAAWSLDGTHIGMGGLRGVARICSGQDGSLVRSFGEFGAAITSAAFAADGKTFYVGTGNARLWVCDLADGTPPWRGMPKPGAVTAIAVERHTGQMLVGGKQPYVQVIADRQALQPFPHHPWESSVLATGYVDDDAGRQPAVISADGTLAMGIDPTAENPRAGRRWSLALAATHAAISPGGVALVAKADGGIDVFAIPPRHRIDLRCGVNPTSLAINADNRLLATAAQNALRIFDLATGLNLHLTRTATDDRIQAMAFDATGYRLFLGDRAGKVLIWDATTGLRATPVVRVAEDIRWMDWLPDGRTLVVQSGSFLSLVDIEQGQELKRVRIPMVLAPGFRIGDDSRSLLAFAERGAAMRIDLQSGAAIAAAIAPTGPGNAAMVIGNDAMVTSAADGTVAIWHPDSGRVHQTLRGHTGRVHAMARLANGRLITTADDGHLCIWDIDTGRLIRRMKTGDTPLVGVTASLDGKVFAVADRLGNTYAWMPDAAREAVTVDGNAPNLSTYFAHHGAWRWAVLAQETVDDPDIQVPSIQRARLHLRASDFPAAQHELLRQLTSQPAVEWPYISALLRAAEGRARGEGF